MFEKTYNICNYEDFIKIYPGANNYPDYRKFYDFYYCNMARNPHNLDGPAIGYKLSKSDYYINGKFILNKECYDMHPDVIEYRKQKEYLQEHPELEVFV